MRMLFRKEFAAIFKKNLSRPPTQQMLQNKFDRFSQMIEGVVIA